jgi:RNA polymerase primary sigma factor
MKLNNLKVNGATIVVANNKEIFNRYLIEIEKLKPLTKEEEVCLFKQIETNDDQTAIDKICKHNLLFVVSVARSYAKTLPKSSLTLEDLVSEGNIGLCLAIRKFDYKTGNKFISYAVWWIRQHILKCIQDNIKSIRIPSNIRTVINKYNKKESNLEQIFNRKPTTLEVFESMLEDGNNVSSAQKLDDILDVSTFEKSLNSLVIMDGTVELGGLIKSDELPVDIQLIGKERSELIEKNVK